MNKPYIKLACGLHWGQRAQGEPHSCHKCRVIAKDNPRDAKLVALLNASTPVTNR